MAANKYTMLNNANSYANAVSAAKTACADAYVALTGPITEVDRNWTGKAGDAMETALTDLKNEVRSVHDRLQNLETRMRSQAQSIYNNWPEEETPEE